jgi:hypothetical protein
MIQLIDVIVTAICGGGLGLLLIKLKLHVRGQSFCTIKKIGEYLAK